MGNLTRDPEARFTPKGTCVCELGLAINRKFSSDDGEKREETTFVDVTVWGKAAETISEYCKKGNPLFIEGRLQMDQWEDKTTGQKRTKLKVVAEGFQFIQGKRQEEDEDERPPRQRERSERPPANRPAKPPVDPDLEPEGEDHIPF